MKQYCVISCPIDTYSGYGSRSRDLVKAIYELKKEEWDIQILPQRWGATPWNYIQDHKEKWGFLQSMLNKTGQLHKQPDVWMQVTIPNEFQPVGKYNIGFTAGIETTACDPSWIDGCNRMNITLVSSKHAKTVFDSIGFEQKDQHGRTIRNIKLEKPVEVLFEGADLEVYKYLKPEEIKKTELIKSIDSVKESFCYLFVGHWLQGDIGEDRKNVGLMIKSFLETFKNKKGDRPALILKTSGGGASIMDMDSMLEKLDSIHKQVDGDLPSVYLLHGEISDNDMNQLYNHEKIKAMVSLTKGEGFGRPLLEFTLSKKPVIVSYWSGHTDFLRSEFCCPVTGEIKQIHPSAVVQNMLIPESGWFSPDIKVFKDYLEDVYKNYKKYEELGRRQGHVSKTEYSYDAMKLAVTKYLDQVPKAVQLKLPQLKKIELPKLTKVS